MLKKILIGIAIIIAGILAFALTKPDTFSVERTTSINAPPQIIFSQIDDFHNWLPWSPWEKLDPGMKRTYSGPQNGVGAAYAWEGNSDVGAGRMEILESASPSKILIQLDFTAPMEASSKTEFELTPRGEATEVRWTMSGPNQYISKLMQVFVSMDAMIGKDFESGLAALKAASEKAAAEAPPANAPLTLERTLDAPRAAVWKAWTDPKVAARWWGPKGYTSPVWKLDLREGGKYLASMRGPDGKDIWNTGTYLKIVPQQELQFTDSFADEKGNVVPSENYGLKGFPSELKTRVTFADAGAGKTQMTIHYDEFPGGENRDMSVAGWNESIDKLAELLKK